MVREKEGSCAMEAYVSSAEGRSALGTLLERHGSDVGRDAEHGSTDSEELHREVNR